MSRFDMTHVKPSSRTLTQLVSDSSLPKSDILGDSSVLVDGMSFDSREVSPGDLFCCIPGDHVDGHSFARAAVESGARALLVERHIESMADVPQVVVPNVRAAMGPMASALYEWPSRSLTLVGVTGTNGKTSTATLLGHILQTCGQSTRVFGTLTGVRTTPEAPVLQQQLADCVRDGVRAVVMEVSSHALAQARVDGTEFVLAIFTNLGRDHLDFHGTEEAYFAAKARLFTPQLSARGVTNIDDPRGLLLADSASIPMSTYSRREVSDVEVTAASLRFTWRGQRVVAPIGGEFNVMNVLAACTAAAELGITEGDIAASLTSFCGVRGRFEYVDEGQDFAVVVDYAHTPDALEQVLRTARRVASGRVVVVFGCGGDRDRGKRPLMGQAAERNADVLYLTSDNPRSEDPHDIISEIRNGVSSARTQCVVQPDRARAIYEAVNSANSGDIVVIAGKGHETVQELRDRVLPFDDVDVARDAVRQRSAIA